MTNEYIDHRIAQFPDDLVCQLDSFGRVLSITPNCQSLLGYSPEEIKNTHYTLLMRSPDIASVQPEADKLRVGDIAVFRDVRTQLHHREGHLVTLSWTLQWSKVHKCFVCVGHKITGRHLENEQVRLQAEQQAAIFESITDSVITVDKAWRLTYLNQKSEELLRQSRRELLGRNLWEEFPDAVNSEFEKNFRYALETGETVNFEAHYAPLDNWVEVTVYPSADGLTIYSRSIWERKKIQQQLETTLAELKRSNQELADFAFVASHDLKEPLRKIQVFSDRLLRNPDRFEYEERNYLNRMQSATIRMQQLIEDLLSYSKITTRARPMYSICTNTLLYEAMQDLETSISQKKARIKIHPLPHLRGDPSQIRLVFQNLLSNAIKFHAPGQAPEVSVFAEDIGDNDWTLIIQDNGVGFDPKLSGKLFAPFQRLHSKQEYPGNGIGMAIVKKILDRHGCLITVHSTPGSGTCCRVLFKKSNTKPAHDTD